MSKAPLIALIALLATPALALEEGTYQISAGEVSGEIKVTDRWLSFLVTGPETNPELCLMSGEGAILRGTNGDWASIFETGEEPCVLYGNRASFTHLGAGCALLTSGDCEMSGTFTGVSPEAAGPVQVIRPLLSGRFGRMDPEERRAIQALLAEAGHYEGAIDGAYGPGTEAALIAHLQGMADRGEPVDGNSATFIREMIEGMAEQGRALTAAPAQPAPSGEAQTASGSPVYVGSWSCGGQTYAFTADRYRMINEYDGSVIQEGALRPDAVEGRTAYLELVGYGNLTFDGVGTRNMVMHDPSSGETWDCAQR